MIHIHGGAFKFGDKRDRFGGFADDIARLRTAGIATASINYRMSGETRFPTAVAEVKASIRWLRSHAQQLHIDADAIGLWGKSAGANLARVAGLTDGVQAIVSIVHDDAESPESVYIGAPIQQAPELARRASPVSHVSAAAPATLLQAGTADCLVPGAQSRELYDALLPLVGASGVQVTMLPGAKHGDSVFDGIANLEVVARFLRAHLSAPRGG